MSQLVARKDAKFMAVCMAPDVCKTPVGPSVVPVPYMIICTFDGTDSTAKKVYANQNEILLHQESRGPAVIGDEPGTLGGVVSGVNRGKVWVKDHAKSVYVEGLQMVRDGDLCDMNVAG